MSKVITFSRVYPSYHPRKGEPTYFVEKIWKSMLDQNIDFANYLYDTGKLKLLGKYQYADDAIYKVDNETPKHHTIRAGNRWKVGDKFSPRVWSGKPYQSKQITIAPDIEIKKVWNIKIENCGFYGLLSINGIEFYSQTSTEREGEDRIEKLAANDGLTSNDLLDWFQFPKDVEGQIICWNDKLDY